MNAALFGLVTALTWGGADFIARFTGRAMGHEVALFGMLSVGAVVLTLIVWLGGVPISLEPEGLWLLVVTGVGIMVATLLLYWGFTCGPVTLVAPIAASYPALNVVLEYALGARPSAVQWAAMVAVMVGVVVVARCSVELPQDRGAAGLSRRAVVFISLGAALGFAVSLAAAQHAAPIYGELQTVFIARWISLAAIVVLLLWRRAPVTLPRKWWPLLILQGLLDAGAYLALLAAGTGEGAAIAVVIASGFAVVTVVLARLILKEVMTAAQWLGIAVIVTGVATLSAN